MIVPRSSSPASWSASAPRRPSHSPSASRRRGRTARRELATTFSPRDTRGLRCCHAALEAPLPPRTAERDEPYRLTAVGREARRKSDAACRQASAPRFQVEYPAREPTQRTPSESLYSACLPRRGDAAAPALDDAPGGTLPARVPADPPERLVPGAVQDAAAGRRGHPAADPPLRLRRRDPVLRPAGAAGGDGTGGAVHRTGAAACRRPCARPTIWRACPLRSDQADRLRARDHPPGARAAGRGDAAHRLRGRAVHRRHLRHRGQDRQELQRDQEAVLPRARGGAPPAGAAGRDDARLPAGAGRRRRAGDPDLRFVGRRGLARRLGALRAGADRGAGGRGARQRRAGDLLRQRRDHDPGPHRRPSAPTSTASTGACRWTRRARGSAARPRCRATWIPAVLLGPIGRDRAPRRRRRPARRRARAHLQPGTRHLPRDPDREASRRWCGRCGGA